MGENKKSYIYEFYYSEDSWLMEIEAPRKKVEKLLDEYRKTDPEGYNDWDWEAFLKKKGIKFRGLKPNYVIYF